MIIENEEEGETYLVYSAADEVSSWIGMAMQKMEEYELKS
jgi:hypothetical protein